MCVHKNTHNDHFLSLRNDIRETRANSWEIRCWQRRLDARINVTFPNSPKCDRNFPRIRQAAALLWLWWNYVDSATHRKSEKCVWCRVIRRRFTAKFLIWWLKTVSIEFNFHLRFPSEHFKAYSTVGEIFLNRKFLGAVEFAVLLFSAPYRITQHPERY